MPTLTEVRLSFPLIFHCLNLTTDIPHKVAAFLVPRYRLLLRMCLVTDAMPPFLFWFFYINPYWSGQARDREDPDRLRKTRAIPREKLAGWNVILQIHRKQPLLGAKSTQTDWSTKSSAVLVYGVFLRQQSIHLNDSEKGRWRVFWKSLKLQRNEL